MSYRPLSLLAAACALLLTAPRALAQRPTPTSATPPEADALKHLQWRSIGPANMGGRVTAIAGIPGNAKTFYVAGADGGVFRTRNGGTTFDALFTDQAVYSVGALEVAPSDPNVLWLGSGEGDPRNSASFGNGVYRSTDGGDRWVHLGLDDSERIKRIAVHPKDPDEVWVCALGHEWGANEMRGVFHTSDGGRTWTKQLFVDQDTGCSDIVVDPSNPRILFAGMFTFRRRPWRFDSGGKETALYRTKDGGTTWQKLSGNGLPGEPMDRIGVAIAASRPFTVYMITETKTQGVLFRSDDGGETWARVSSDPRITFRPFYYSDIRVDPTNPEVVYALAGGLYKSTDGGRNFESIGGGVHGDHQAFWIDPLDSDRLLSGSDGGFQLSFDAGGTWNIFNNVALSQYYHVFLDDQEPYRICGGLQDNGNWCGPSRTLSNAGILKDDWFTVSGGDGFYAVPVPGQPHLIYSNSQGGSIKITDTRSGVTRQIDPYPKRVGSVGDAIVDHKYRFNWDAPIYISPHDPATVYFGGNVLFRSTNYGQSWEEISPDLTTDDPEKQQSSGGEIVTDNTAAEFHTTILTISESPVQRGVIWVGTDDGNIQVTQDGGANWTNVTRNVPGLPPFSWIARVEASWKEAGTAYVAVDRHRDDDFSPHAFMTTDFGETWTSITGDLPARGYVQVVREDPRNSNLLYAGTELGVFASWDRGKRWVSIRNNLPPVSVRDIRVHPRDNDLVIGTHGRGIFILDDAGPLQQLASALQQEAHLFDSRAAVRWQMWNRSANLGQATYRGENPDYGALIRYFVKSAPEQPAVLTVSDGQGHVIRTVRQRVLGTGVNTIVWDLRHDPAPSATSEQGGGGGGGGGGGFGGGGGGPTAIPGDYALALRVGDHELRGNIRVEPDPRVELTAADYQAQLDAALQVREQLGRVNAILDEAESIRTQLSNLTQLLERNGAAAEEKAAVKAALDEISAFVEEDITRPPPRMGYRQYPRLREEVTSLLGQVQGAQAPPTAGQLTRVREVRVDADAAQTQLDAIVDGTIQRLNERLGSWPRVVTKRVVT